MKDTEHVIYTEAPDHDRQAQFRENAKKWIAHNTNTTKKTWTKGMTLHADWTEEEFFGHYNLNAPAVKCTAMSEFSSKTSPKLEAKKNADNPLPIDWRSAGVVTPVKA